MTDVGRRLRDLVEQPAPQLGLPAPGRRRAAARRRRCRGPRASRSTSCGRCRGVRREDAGQPARDRPAAGCVAARPPSPSSPWPRWRASVAAHGSSRWASMTREQRPHQSVGVPGVVALAPEQQRHQRVGAEEPHPGADAVALRHRPRGGGTAVATATARHRGRGRPRPRWRTGRGAGRRAGLRGRRRAGRRAARGGGPASLPLTSLSRKQCGDGPQDRARRRQSGVSRQVKTLTPPGPTSSPTTISTIPISTAPRISDTTPLITRITAQDPENQFHLPSPLSAAARRPRQTSHRHQARPTPVQVNGLRGGAGPCGRDYDLPSWWSTTVATRRRTSGSTGSGSTSSRSCG